MAEENNLDVQLLSSRGLNCKRLRKLEDKQRDNMRESLRNAQDFRRYGFLTGAETQEKVANVQKEMADKLGAVRKQACGLNK